MALKAGVVCGEDPEELAEDVEDLLGWAPQGPGVEVLALDADLQIVGPPVGELTDRAPEAAEQA